MDDVLSKNMHPTPSAQRHRQRFDPGFPIPFPELRPVLLSMVS